MEQTKNQMIGGLVFYCHDLSRRISIKEYLKELLLVLWKEEEGFSGKRPFGNSGWQYDIYKCLVKNKIIKGKLDEDGYVEECDVKKGEEIILEVIKDL